jgi:hypothetical protein
MTEGTFDVQITLHATPGVTLSTDRRCCWLSLDTFTGAFQHSGITVHLPGHGEVNAAAARRLADALMNAAALIDQAVADQAAREHAAKLDAEARRVFGKAVL